MTTGNWRKSSRSGQGGSQCVEARLHGDTPQLSDSKLPDNRPIVTMSVGGFSEFVAAVKAGELDLKQ